MNQAAGKAGSGLRLARAGWGCSGPAIAALFALIVAAPAPAVVPPADRVRGAVSEANRSAGRTARLRIQLEVVRAETEVVGTGELLADPSGEARLELRAASGLVERHLRRGEDYRASRNALLLPAPDPILPPLGPLQAPTASALGSALLRMGASPDYIALGHAGDHDCYVLGGRLPGPDRGGFPLRAAFWVDLETLEPVRLDRADGVRYRFGPATRFGDIRLPAWLAVERPGQPELRLVLRGAQAEAPGPGAFDPAWLTRHDFPGAGAPGEPGGAEQPRTD